ncbi:hypothetical protein JMA_22220 [Jeotgalibacillus malaysiensis]|uniref:Uncharacterized protein n=1 Tax=Jeotgalibacillus malaysiensis TaxID=1508404 RepID=A0A0B5AU48_9BACL|nr:hypothetical protein [Jeotgalibacillus malaysiensis]AJD91539.1 hypothetical protein JMA_22220 [Jeotgalibacillus malaysiensis]
MEIVKAPVLKPFKNKEDKRKRYKKDDFFEGTEQRVQELQRLGYVGQYEVTDKKVDGTPLDGNVEEVKSAINADFSKEELEKFLVNEQQGKNRQGVQKHIEDLIAEKNEEKPEGE